MEDNMCRSHNCKCLKFNPHLFKKNKCIDCSHSFRDHDNVEGNDWKFAELAEKDNLPCKITDNVYMGSMKAALNKNALKSAGITHVINCAQSLLTFIPKFVEYREDFTYLTLPMIDSLDFDIKDHVLEALNFIEKAVQENGKIFIHCAQGISRSGSIVVAYLMKTYHKSYDEALSMAKKGRIICNPNNNFKAQLIYIFNENVLKN